MSFISYAQNFEDVLLWRALKDVPAGFYIDVGANDPELHSVTKAFYDHGWSGINIEPMPSYGAAFREQRPRDINLNVAAGASAGSITLFDVPDVNGWASTDAAVAAAHRAHGHAVVEHTVPLLTLAEICRDHVRGPVHFLKIDVEGYEGDVLRGMDFTRCRPWIVVVEAIMPNSRDSNHADWEALITAHDYQYAWFDGLNRYYVAAEQAHLAAVLQLPPNVFDDFLPHHLDKAWRRGEQLAQQVETSWQLAQQHGARVAQLSAEHAAQAQQLAQRTQELRQRQSQVLQLQADLRQSEAQAQQLDSRLHQTAAWGSELEQRLLAVYASTSWRLTAPLRFLLRRGEHSLPRLLQRKARGALRRGVRWLTSRQWLRRLLLPLVARSPRLQRLVHRTLHVLHMGAAPAAGAADVPFALRELPLSARQVLADLERARHTHRS
jgi:FkbM family methyltransferase